jgi:hypothetical protein
LGFTIINKNVTLGPTSNPTNKQDFKSKDEELKITINKGKKIQFLNLTIANEVTKVLSKNRIFRLSRNTNTYY